MVILKRSINFGVMVMVESLAFPPLLTRPTFHGDTEVRVKSKINFLWNYYYTY